MLKKPEKTEPSPIAGRFVRQQTSPSNVVTISIVILLVTTLILYLFLAEEIPFEKVFLLWLVFAGGFSIVGFSLKILPTPNFFSLSIRDVFFGFLLGCFSLVFSVSWVLEPELSRYFPWSMSQFTSSNGVHVDTVFHVSLIEGILGPGYPSLPIDGFAPVSYHALSHFIDALILSAVGLEPAVSYGILFQSKAMILTSLLLINLLQIAGKLRPLLILLLAPLLFSLYLQDWTALGSHSQSYATLLILASAQPVVRTLRNSSTSSRDFFFLGLLGILLAFMKVSAGAMYMAIIATWLVRLNWSKYQYWAMVSLWLLFGFLASLPFLQRLDNPSPIVRDASVTGPLSWIRDFPPEAQLIIGLATISVFLWKFTRARVFLQYAVSILVGLLVFFSLTAVDIGMSWIDYWYFINAVQIFATVWLFQLCAQESPRISSWFQRMGNGAVLSFFLAVLVFLSASNYTFPHLLRDLRSPEIVQVFLNPRNIEENGFGAELEGSENLLRFGTAADGLANQNRLAEPERTFVLFEPSVSEKILEESLSQYPQQFRPVVASLLIGKPLVAANVAGPIRGYGFQSIEVYSVSKADISYPELSLCLRFPSLVYFPSEDPSDGKLLCGWK